MNASELLGPSAQPHFASVWQMRRKAMVWRGSCSIRLTGQQVAAVVQAVLRDSEAAKKIAIACRGRW